MRDKKMVCGILLTVIGFCTFFFCFVYAILHPWNYNGTDGLLGSLLGTHTLGPFIISFIVMIVGIAICFWRAFKSKE